MNASLFYLREMAYEFLRGVSCSLLDILGFDQSTTSEEYAEYIRKGIKIKQEDWQRHEKMKMQKKYGLPIRPNQDSRELRTTIKITELKKKKREKNNDDRNDNLLSDLLEE